MFFQKKFDFVKEFKHHEFKKGISFKLDGIRFSVEGQKLTWVKDSWKYYLFWGTKFMDDGMFCGIGNIVDSLVLSLIEEKEFNKVDSLGPYIPECSHKVYLDSKAKDLQATCELQKYIWDVMNSYRNTLNNFEINDETKVKKALDNLLK